MTVHVLTFDTDAIAYEKWRSHFAHHAHIYCWNWFSIMLCKALSRVRKLEESPRGVRKFSVHHIPHKYCNLSYVSFWKCRDIPQIMAKLFNFFIRKGTHTRCAHIDYWNWFSSMPRAERDIWNNWKICLLLRKLDKCRAERENWKNFWTERGNLLRGPCSGYDSWCKDCDFPHAPFRACSDRP